jgi:hypothetical protein
MWLSEPQAEYMPPMAWVTVTGDRQNEPLWILLHEMICQTA